MIRMNAIVIVCATLVFSGCTNKIAPPSNMSSLTLTSPRLTQNQPIGRQFTCDGENVSPELHIANLPQQAKSIVLIMDDPDSPTGLWTHWMLFNIPPTTTSLPQGSTSIGEPGKNTFGNSGYGGPCPHQGKHRYVFTLHALDTTLTLKNPTRTELDRAIAGHVLATTSLMGTYERARQ